MAHYVYNQGDGDMIKRTGKAAVKKPNPVYLVQIEDATFAVETKEGTLTGKPGDYLAHDPMSGNVWVVAESYVAMHYDFLSQIAERSR